MQSLVDESVEQFLSRNMIALSKCHGQAMVEMSHKRWGRALAAMNDCVGIAEDVVWALVQMVEENHA